MDLSGPKIKPFLLGKRYVMLLKHDYSRHAWVYFLKHKLDSGDAFRKFLADARADGVPSEVVMVRSGNRGEFFGGEFGEVCEQVCIKQEITIADSPKQNERCCREGTGYHPEDSTRSVYPSAYHFSPRSTAADKVPVGGSDALGY